MSWTQWVEDLGCGIYGVPIDMNGTLTFTPSQRNTASVLESKGRPGHEERGPGD